MLEKKLQEELMDAMKSHDTIKVDAIRAIKSAIQIERTKGASHELEDADIVKIISKLSKQYQEDIEQYAAAGRNDLVEKSTKEKNIFDSYLPKVLSNDEVKKKIDIYLSELNATSMKDMGKVMGVLAKDLPNQYDPKFASAYIKEMLTQK